MKAYIKLIAAGLVILISNNIVLGTNVPSFEEEDNVKGRQEWEVRRALSEKLIFWLSDANGLAGEECDKLVDSLLALPEPSIKAYFVAAQVTYIRGKPQKAISILEDLISKHPDKPAEVMQIPVRVVARFWIGTIARHSGDMTKAKNIYQTILENLEGLKGKTNLAMICNLYLSEIESKHMKRNDLAMERLEEIKQLERPAGHGGEQYEIYKNWAEYQYTRISKGKSQATQQLVPYGEIQSAPTVAATQLNLCGMSKITGDYRADYKYRTLEGDIITRTLFGRFRNNTISAVDWSLVTFVYGYGYACEAKYAQMATFVNEPGHACEVQLSQKKEEYYLEAEKYLSALFDDDSFFSPVAGLYLALCKKAQDKTVEAESILEKVRTKYPGYDSAVTKLRESWEKQTKENTKND